MKQVKLFAMALSATFIGLPVIGQNLYVYDTEKEKEVLSLKNVQKIIFEEAEMKIELSDGNQKPVLFSDFDFFSFAPKSYTALSDIDASPLSVYYDADADQLTIESSQSISSVDIFSIQGIRQKSITTESTDACVSMESLPKGIYLVKVQLEGKAITHKIIKR